MSVNRARRRVLLGVGATMVAGIASPAIANVGRANVRRLSFDNLHTGEKVDAEYWADGAYIPDALKEIDRVLRDFCTGEAHAIDRNLLNVLVLLREELETDAALEIFSAYRSPKTNAMLRKKSKGVAASSLHMDGMAIDLRLSGRQLTQVRDAAISLSAGGVGYYPKDGFVHVDTGAVHRW